MHVVLLLPTGALSTRAPQFPAEALRRLAGQGLALGAVTRRPPLGGVPDCDLPGGGAARVRWWAADPADPACAALLGAAFGGTDVVLDLATGGAPHVTTAAAEAGARLVASPGPDARGAEAVDEAVDEVVDEVVVAVAALRAARGTPASERLDGQPDASLRRAGRYAHAPA